MENVISSFYLVINANQFLTMASITLMVGIFWGWLYDQKFAGFRRSLSLIAPHSILIIITSLFRITEYSTKNVFTANAYNGVMTILLTTFFYIIGLFIGHMIDHNAKNQAQATFVKPLIVAEKEAIKEQQNTMSDNVKSIKTDVEKLVSVV